MFSAVLALSLSPMMCSKLLRTSTRESKLTHALDKAFEWLSDRYQRGCAERCARRGCRWLACVAIGGRRVPARKAIPQEYAPQEDRGQFNGSIQAPEGASFGRLKVAAKQVEKALQPYFDDGTIVRGVGACRGWNNQSGIVNVSEAVGRAQDRHEGSRSTSLSKQWEEIPDVRVIAFINNGNNRGGGGSPCSS